jgi:hypothetical protein
LADGAFLKRGVRRGQEECRASFGVEFMRLGGRSPYHATGWGCAERLRHTNQLVRSVAGYGGLPGRTQAPSKRLTSPCPDRPHLPADEYRSRVVAIEAAVARIGSAGHAQRRVPALPAWVLATYGPGEGPKRRR